MDAGKMQCAEKAVLGLAQARIGVFLAVPRRSRSEGMLSWNKGRACAHSAGAYERVLLRLPDR